MVRMSVRRRVFGFAAPVLAATVTVIVSGAQDKPKPDAQKAAAAAPEFKDLDSFMKSLAGRDRQAARSAVGDAFHGAAAGLPR